MDDETKRDLLELVSNANNAIDALAKFIIAYQERVPPPERVPGSLGAVTLVRVNVRKVPSPFGGLIETLAVGTPVQVIGEPVSALGYSWVPIGAGRWVVETGLKYD